VPGIFVILPRRLARLQGERLPHLAQQLFAGFVQAQLRPFRVVRALVDIEHVFHVPDKFRVLLGRNTPALFQPRLKFIFF
jgi:hypothetical protein